MKHIYWKSLVETTMSKHQDGFRWRMKSIKTSGYIKHRIWFEQWLALSNLKENTHQTWASFTEFTGSENKSRGIKLIHIQKDKRCFYYILVQKSLNFVWHFVLILNAIMPPGQAQPFIKTNICPPDEMQFPFIDYIRTLTCLMQIYVNSQGQVKSQ